MAEDLLTRARALRTILEAALARGRRELAVSSALGLLLSVVGFFLLGAVVYFLILYYTAKWQDARGEPFVFPAGVFFALYNLGLPMRGGGTVDNPLTFRDDFDRFHMMLGFLLIIPTFVRLNLLGILDHLRSGKPVRDPSLAAAILLLAKDGTPLGRIASVLFPFGEQALQDALGYLKLLGWIRVHETGKYRTASLTERGQDVLAGRFGVDACPSSCR
jgi:hypothetical protein